jgi:hypothetical protein
LFGAGVTHIPHWAAQPSRVYGQILNGKNPMPLLTLVGDVDMGVRPAADGRAQPAAGSFEGATDPKARRWQWASVAVAMVYCYFSCFVDLLGIGKLCWASLFEF